MMIRALLVISLSLGQLLADIKVIRRRAMTAGAAASVTYADAQLAISETSNTTVAVTLNSVGSGNLVACWVSQFGATTTISVSDGSSLTAGTKATLSDDEAEGQWFYTLSATSGNRTYTATLGAARQYKSIHCYRYTYTGTAALDQQNSGQTVGGGTAVASGNITTTAAVAVVLAGYLDVIAGSATSEQIGGVAASHTLDDATLGTGVAESWDRILSSTATLQATATSSHNTWLCAIINFKFT